MRISVDQGSLWSIGLNGAPSSHSPLCSCGTCAAPVQAFEAPKVVDGVERFTDSFHGVESRIVGLADGRYSVELWDTDAGKRVPMSYQFSDLEAARVKARKLAGVK